MSNWPVHFAGRSLAIFASLLLGTGAAQAASTPIYKCFDQHLALVYTDVPCKDGEQLDLRAGDADPAAVARLERERELLSLAAAQRLADERRAALQVELADRSRSVAVEPNAPDMLADYGYGYPAFAYAPKARPRHHLRRAAAQQSRFAPPPPYVVPRPHG